MVNRNQPERPSREIADVEAVGLTAEHDVTTAEKSLYIGADQFPPVLQRNGIDTACEPPEVTFGVTHSHHDTLDQYCDDFSLVRQF